MPGISSNDPSPMRTPGRPLSDACAEIAGSVVRAPQLEDRQYAAMLAVYDRHGGMLTTDTAVELLRSTHDQPVSVLARWIVSGDVVHFVWKSETLLPRFQFDRRGTAVLDEVACVLREIRKAFDDWDIAMWFATPNHSLLDRTPVDILGHDPRGVIQAARLDRFIALG